MKEFEVCFAGNLNCVDSVSPQSPLRRFFGAFDRVTWSSSVCPVGIEAVQMYFFLSEEFTSAVKPRWGKNGDLSIAGQIHATEEDHVM